MNFSRKKIASTASILLMAVSLASCSSSSTSVESGKGTAVTDPKTEQIKSELFSKQGEYLTAKNYQGAIDVSNQMMKYEPSFGYKLRAESYMRMGNYEQADKDIKEAIKLDPENGSMYDYAAIIATHMKRYDEVIKMADLAIKHNYPGGTTSGYRCLGIAYHALKNDQKSIENFDKSIKQQEDLEDRYLRGAVYDSMGKSQEALVDFAAATKWDPDLQSAYKRRAVIYTRLGQKAKANAELSAAKERLKSKLMRGTVDWIPLDLSAAEMPALVKNPKAGF
jgi:tetratricopeptide (TPR) repeat protein